MVPPIMANGAIANSMILIEFSSVFRACPAFQQFFRTTLPLLPTCATTPLPPRSREQNFLFLLSRIEEKQLRV